MQARDHWERESASTALLCCEGHESLLADKSCKEAGQFCHHSREHTVWHYWLYSTEVCRRFQRMWSTRLHIQNPAKVGCTRFGVCGLNGPRTIERWSWENKEQARMTVLAEIKKVKERTAWFISIVVTKKKRGEFRICMDPKDLNQNLKHKHYQILSGEEIISEMAVALLHKAWLVTRPLAAQTGWKQQQILCLQYVLWLVLSSCLLE